jgi:alkylation response protein AidB-like acyl-CoA dehydrogenase
VDWDDTSEQAAFREDVRGYIQEALPQYYKQRIADKKEASADEEGWQFDMMHGSPEAKAAAHEWMEALNARGWSAPSFPSEYGGASLSTIEQFILKQ